MDVKTYELEKSSSESSLLEPWRLILFNDDYHIFDEVVFQIMKATGYSMEESTSITLEAHYKGQALVFEGSFERCFEIDQVLKEIDLTTEIRG